MTNVGKSTLMNRLLERLAADDVDKPEKKREVTTSPYPGTTLDTISVPLGDGGFLIDTPGLIHGKRLIHFLVPEDLRRVVPRRRIRPKIYQLEPAQTLFFGGLARLDFRGGPRQSFVCYVSDDVRIHRTKLARADDVYREHAGELLSPPGRAGYSAYPALTKRRLQVKKGQDVAIAGLGWIAVKGERAELDLWVPKEIAVAVRESMY
jgi:ribosome biogenesis GTPase A